MTNAAEIVFGKDRHVRCFAHLLNLVASAEIHRKDSPVRGLFDRVSNIVAYFKRSVRASDALKAAQLTKDSEGTPLRLIERFKTRWNSDFDMAERFLQLADVIGSSLLRVGRDGPRMLSGQELDTLKEVTHLLKPLKDATTEMSAEKVTTASKVIPLVSLMRQASFKFF